MDPLYDICANHAPPFHHGTFDSYGSAQGCHQNFRLYRPVRVSVPVVPVPVVPVPVPIVEGRDPASAVAVVPGVVVPVSLPVALMVPLDVEELERTPRSISAPLLSTIP